LFALVESTPTRYFVHKKHIEVISKDYKNSNEYSMIDYVS